MKKNTMNGQDNCTLVVKIVSPVSMEFDSDGLGRKFFVASGG